MAALRRAVWDLIVTQDAFGIKADKKAGKNPFTTNTRWRFASNDNKLVGYQKWLKAEVDKGLLQVSGVNNDTPWMSQYLDSTYRKGITRAYTDTHAADLIQTPEEEIFGAGGKKQFLETAFSAPVAQSKLRILHNRAFTYLKGISADMDKEMSRILVEGLSRGHGPAKIAKLMNDAISGIERKRALVIARTELAYAHSEGQLDAFEAMGVDKIGVMVEWSTAADDRVCEMCGPMEGDVMSVQEARGLIPRHPNCRCAYIPAGVGEETTGSKKTIWASAGQELVPPGTLPTGKTTFQKWSPSRVEESIRKSIKAEKPNLPIKEARKESKWAGADITKISKKR